MFLYSKQRVVTSAILRISSGMYRTERIRLVLDAHLAGILSDNESIQCQSPFYTNGSKNPKIIELNHVLFDRLMIRFTWNYVICTFSELFT